MKKIITIMLAIISSIFMFNMVGCSKEESSIIKGYNGKVTGVDIYLMALVCEELDMKMEVNDVDFNGIVGAVATKDNAVGAAGITINDERKTQVAFSNPYYNSVQYIVSKDSQAYTSFEQLAGKKIGVQKGTTGALMVADAIESGVLKGTGATCLEYNTGAVAFTAMKSNKCDFVVIDELPAKKLVLNQSSYVANAVSGIEVEEYGLCVSQTSSMKETIIAAMNKVINEAEIDVIVAYFTSVANDEKPSVSLNTVDLSDNKGGTIEVYTCSGFEPYEFVID